LACNEPNADGMGWEKKRIRLGSKRKSQFSSKDTRSSALSKTKKKIDGSCRGRDKGGKWGGFSKARNNDDYVGGGFGIQERWSLHAIS